MAKTAHRSQYASTAQLEKFLNQAFETTDSRQSEHRMSPQSLSHPE
jgi:hypothetical protein